MSQGSQPLRALPSVDEVLSRPAVRALEASLGHAVLKAAARAAIAAARDRLRQGLGAGGDPVPDEAVLEACAREAGPRLRRVVNATGVVLHTNLGRAPLHPEALARAAEVAGGWSNLELDLASGRRGHRAAAVEPLLCELTGAEAAFAVNNGAAAALLALSALGGAGAAVVSRGELVEIGGGFRVPEILAQSGCRLVEVGTTNRTRLDDYARALDELGVTGPAASGAAILLRVHRSNFALVGFSQEPRLSELAALARTRGVLLVHDLGSGALRGAVAPGLPEEPTAAGSLAAGADLVTCSGDKLLGGPQAGLLLGRREAVERCRRHPLARALRVDKMILAALEATLRLHRDGRAHELPALRALGEPHEALEARATQLGLQLVQRGVGCAVVECEGKVGGGSMPLARLPSRGVAVECEDPRALAALLREGRPAPLPGAAGPPPLLPALALVRDGKLLLDVRTVLPEQLAGLADLVAEGLRRLAAAPGRADPADGARLQAVEESEEV